MSSIKFAYNDDPLADTSPINIGNRIKVETKTDGCVILHLPIIPMSDKLLFQLKDVTQTLSDDGIMHPRKARIFIDRFVSKLHEKAVIAALIDAIKSNNQY